MSTATPTLAFTPAPAAQPLTSMVLAQTRFELRQILRNGEQLLLTVIIPLVLLIGLASVSWIDLGEGSRIDLVTPGVLTVAVMSSAFTSLAIGTGFDRRYGVLKLLGATPLSRTGLVAAKMLATLALIALQVVMISLVALALGWRPQGNVLVAVGLIVLATAAFAAIALALAGVLRAEATLAVANAIFLLLLFAGGSLISADKMPSWLSGISQALPSGALGAGLRDVLIDGTGVPLWSVLVLAAWFVLGAAVAIRTFKWE